jgi:hypothetical protein
MGLSLVAEPCARFALYICPEHDGSSSRERAAIRHYGCDAFSAGPALTVA